MGWKQNSDGTFYDPSWQHSDGSVKDIPTKEPKIKRDKNWN